MSVRSVNLERLGLLADLVLFEPRHRVAQLVERRAGNPEAMGSNPTSAVDFSNLSQKLQNI